MNGVESEFEAVRNAELVKDIVEVVLHGLLGDEEFLADFLVAEALGNELNDFFFAITQERLFSTRAGLGGFGKRFHDFGRHAIVEPNFTGVDAMNAFHKKVGGGLFEHDTAGTQAHGANDIAIVFRSGKDNNARGNRIEINFLEDGETVLFRHSEVEQKNVGFELREQLDAFGAVLRFANDGDVLVAIDELAKAVAKNRVVVGHENSNLLFGLRHILSQCFSKQPRTPIKSGLVSAGPKIRHPSGTSIVRRAPCPGFDSTVRTPFTVRVRSLMEMGPSRRRSSSSPVKRPAKLKPSPLSSTTKSSLLSSCESFTTTWVALACFFILLSASR